MRIAALDIGTNTVLLLVVEASTAPVFKVLLDRHAIARLGEGVDETMRISDVAFERFRSVLRKHMAEIKRLNVDLVVAVATSAMRDALNADEIIVKVREEFGLRIEVISGTVESELTFRGALVGLALPSGCDQLAVLDIGGGSTELSFGTPTYFRSGASFDVGALRMTERYLGTQDSKLTSITQPKEAMEASIRLAISQLAPSLSTIQELVAVAGTPTTLAAMDLGLSEFDATRIQGYRLRSEAIVRLLGEIRSLSREALVEKYPAVNKGRADILLAGSMILHEVMLRLSVDSVLVSTRGLRYGFAIRELERALNLPATQWLLSEA